jgi:hypothetical protein
MDERLHLASPVGAQQKNYMTKGLLSAARRSIFIQITG